MTSVFTAGDIHDTASSMKARKARNDANASVLTQDAKAPPNESAALVPVIVDSAAKAESAAKAGAAARDTASMQPAAVPSTSTGAKDLAGIFAPPAPKRNILEELHVGLPLIFGTVAVYTSMLAGTFIGLADQVERLQPAERIAATTAGTVLAASAIARIQYLYAHPENKVTMAELAMLSANVMASSANLLMGTVGTPVLVDPMTGASEYMVRWCEWGTLGFLMTFVVEAISAQALAEPLSLGVFIGFACTCGYIFPLCTNPYVWTAMMLLCCGSYLPLYPRYFRRRRIYNESLAQRVSPSDVGTIVADKVAHQLSLCCLVMWTVITADFFITWALGRARGDAFKTGADRAQWPFLLDCALDVTAKLLYAGVVSKAHAHVPAEAERQQELWIREAMDAVWAGAQDTVILSEMRRDGTARTIASKGLATIFNADVAERWASWRAHFVGCSRWEGYTEDTLSSHGSVASVSTAAPDVSDAQEALEELIQSAWYNASAVARTRHGGDVEEEVERKAMDTISMRWEAPPRAAGADPTWCEVEATRCVRTFAGSPLPTPFLVLVITDISEKLTEEEDANKERVGAQCAEALVAFHMQTTDAFQALDGSAAALEDGLTNLTQQLDQAAASGNADNGADEVGHDDAGDVDTLVEMGREVRRTVNRLCKEVSLHGSEHWEDTQRALATIKGELASLNAVSGCGECKEISDVASRVDDLLAHIEPPARFRSTSWRELLAVINRALIVSAQ